MTVQTTAGVTLGISAGLPASETFAAYSGLTYAELGEATNLGQFGQVYNLVTHSPIASRDIRKFKGTRNNGSMNVELAVARADAGQIVARAALDSDDNYAFELTYQDGTLEYFQGKVMSFTTNVGTADQIVAGTITIELDTQPLAFDAAGTPI
jgi:hypothetical protein